MRQARFCRLGTHPPEEESAALRIYIRPAATQRHGA